MLIETMKGTDFRDVSAGGECDHVRRGSHTTIWKSRDVQGMVCLLGISDGVEAEHKKV